MTFNPMKHHRRSIRLQGYDYSRPGAYYVTLCVRNREWLFGNIQNKHVVLNESGEFAQSCWIEIPRHFPHVQIDEFIIMPNHIHGILIFHDFPTVGATDPVAQGITTIDIKQRATGSVAPTNQTGSVAPTNQTGSVAPTNQTGSVAPINSTKLKSGKCPNGPPPGSLGAVIGQYKSVVTKRINSINNTPGKHLWQRDFYDHIGRNGSDLDRIRQYIRNNPAHWDTDRNNPGITQPKFVSMPNAQRS